MMTQDLISPHPPIRPDLLDSTTLRSIWRRVTVLLACTFALSAGATPPVTSGLVLHLETDRGVTVRSDGVVTRWTDLSASRNDLLAGGAPQFRAAATPSGQAAVYLDGRSAKMERQHATHRLANLPSGAANRSVFVVSRYHRASAWAGFAYGAGQANRAFGLSVRSSSGELLLQGWGSGNDLLSTYRAVGGGWTIQGGVYRDGLVTLYRDGSRLAERRHTFATSLQRIALGQEIAGLGYAEMDAAAVLIYNRALSDAERSSVEAYLRNKYLVATAKNVAPTLSISRPTNDSTSVVGDSVTFTGQASDPEDGNLSGSIEWTSDRQGSLGRGASFSTRQLQAGAHVITARVVDSRQAAASRQVRHTVNSTPPPAPPPTTSQPPPSSRRIVKLFNGKDLSGLYVWCPPYGRADPDRIFTVQNGLLRVAGEAPYAALVSEKEYGNYIMTLEFKWGPKTYGARTGKARDAGILLHSRGRDGGWRNRLMANIEVQVMEGGMGDLMLLKGADPMRMTVACNQLTCESRTWYCRGEHRWDPRAPRRTFQTDLDTAHAKTWDPAWKDVAGFRGRHDLEKPLGEWNQFIVVADGDRLEVYFNGVKVNEAFNVFPSSGRVQLESEQAEYYVRRWELELLE